MYKMKRIILTGFGSFGNNSINPTEEIISHFEERECVKVFLLPVVYDECYQMIEKEEGDIFLHLGLAEGRKTITIERYAYNEKKAESPDNKGNIHSGTQIIENADMRLETPFDITTLIKALAVVNIKAEESIDPGRYVCNNIYYHSLSNKRNSLFVHFPTFENLSQENAVRAVETIIHSIIKS